MKIHNLYNRIIYIIFAVILFQGCSRSQESAFDDLKTAFIGWFLKANPVISESFYQLENVEGWHNYNNESYDEYFADLHRFLIELSQIDRSKLSEQFEFEYLILWSYLTNTLYFEDQLKPLQWNFNLWVDKLNNGLHILNLECGTLTAREENILKSRLNTLDEFSEQIIYYLSSPINKFTLDGQEKLSHIQDRLDEFLNECRVDSNILERWEPILNNSDYHLNTLMNDVNQLTQLEYPMVDLNIWSIGYENYFGQFLDEITNKKHLNIEIQKIISKMLMISLPSYLKNYDEPIWVSQQDTLHVIKTIFNSFKNKTLKSSMIVEKSNEILIELSRNLKRENILSFNLPKFNYKISTLHNIFNSTFKSSFSRNYNADFYIPEIDDSVYVINDIMLEYYLINEVFPGKITLLTKSNKSGKLEKLLQDKMFLSGWKLYIQDLLINSDYIKNKPELALILLENKLLSILKLKYQMEYFSSENFEMNTKLQFSESSIHELNDYWFNPIPIYDYLILHEILDLKDRYLMNDKLDLIRFNNWIGRGGSHSIYVRQNLLKN